MPDGSLTIVAKPHPLQSERVFCQAAAGQTIAQLLGDAAHSCEVTVGGHPVPRELWSKVRPKAGQMLHVTVYPQGGGEGSKYVRTALMIALTIYAPGLAASLTSDGALLAGANTALVTAGLMALGSLAINALIPPPTPKLSGGAAGDPFQQLNSLTGTSNQATPYGAIPCVVGTKRFYPPHAALPYTEVNGDDQYLRMLLDLGYGDLDISDIRIGETDIASYDDVEWEISTSPTLFMQDIYELAVGANLTELNDNVTRTTQAGTSEISLDLVFAGGLYGWDDRANTVTGSVQFSVQYRAVGASTWIDAATATGISYTGGLSLYGGTIFTVNSAKRKTLRCGIRWTVPSGQYEVSVTRGNTTFGGTTAGSVSDCVFSVLRSITPENPSSTGTNKLAVRIKATDQLNGVVQNLSVLASQRIRGIDPVTFLDTPAVATENPAWIYLWLMTQCEAVMRRVPLSRIDLPGICAWADECTAKGYKIGFVMDSVRAFGDLIRDVLAAGRASFGLHNGQYSAVRDIEQAVPVQMFTPANSGAFSYSRSFIEPPHALRVKFTNPEANDQQDVRIVYWDGYTSANATRFEELDLSMVIDPDAAWRLGRYHLAVLWNRPTQYVLQADLEHMVCERGDLVHVAHDITGWGLAWGRVKAVSGTTITLDGPVTLESGKSYQLRVRGEDNAQAIATVTSGAGTTQTLDLDSAVGAPGDLFVLGEVSRGVAQLIVRAIEPGDDFTATLTCVDAASAVWDADSGTPPAFVSSITGKPWCAPPPPPVVTIRAGDSAPDDAGVIKAVTGVSSQPQGGIFRFHPVHGGCVVVESFLPDMRRAGDVAVGDTLHMADPDTLAPRQDRATYSKAVLQPCVEIVTASGVVLRCSTSAPIPTQGHGLVLAPHLAGKCVAVMDGNGERWEPVTRIRGIGQRMVQHISVNDGCFWAGAEPGRFILHHNKQPVLMPDRASGVL